MVDVIEPPAFYGKLPGHGDFVGRGLSGGQEAVIDRWLSGWLAAAREEWGEAFDSNYRAAQPWLFAGERLSAIAIPSTDRVGREFPLLAAMDAAAGSLQLLYDTVVTGIAEAWDGDRLLTQLGTIAPSDDAIGEPVGWFVPDADERAMPHPSAQGGEDAIGALLA